MSYRELRDAVWARAWNSGLTTPQLVVALRLVEHWPDIFPGEKTLARWTQLGVSTVREALNQLEALRVIRIMRTPGRVNQYQFLDPAGAAIVRVFPDVGPTPPGAGAPPRQELAHPPPGAGAPTPPGAGAEADPDPKQDSKQTREAGPRALLPHELAEQRKALEQPDGSRPAPLYRFREGWNPKQSHLALGLELGLTKAEMLAELADCRDKVYERPIQSEDAQFRRELRWLATDKQTRQFRESRKANPHGYDENPGARRRPGDASTGTVFGSLAGGRRSR